MVDRSRVSCLRVDEHHENVRNPLVHYLGCLKVAERKEFLSKLELKSGCEENDRIREDCKKSIEKGLRRLQFLRDTLSKDEFDRNLVESVKTAGREWAEVMGRTKNATKPGPKADYKLESDMSAYVMDFSMTDNGHDGIPGLLGTFPDQKVTIQRLLYDDNESLLSRGKDPKSQKMRYFHIPSNNMEKAVSKYFGDEEPRPITNHRLVEAPQQTPASMILQDRYWRGHLHGSSDSPPHARYMAAMCDTVSSKPGETDLEPNNIVLFMPFLHWETSRKRKQFAEETSRLVEQAKKKRAEDIKDEKERRRRERGNAPTDRYLRAAADLYEGITTYRDKKLLRKYFSTESPIHPRRTLDQAFYWTLRSTEKRDRDQVVFRGTTTRYDDWHRCSKEDSKHWPDHDGLKGEDCQVCLANIKRVSRVVMVDQLWMWVLDERTIITCFSKRYGQNKQDSSGVHKSIRRRVEMMGPDAMRTVFELGLIILDECTSTFFNRATGTEQPRVTDEFSKATGNIMDKQTSAFNMIVALMEEKHIRYLQSQNYVDTTDLFAPLLDINYEAKLEREIVDVIEELDIMLYIANIHADTVKSYIDQVDHILNPGGELPRCRRRNRGKMESHEPPNEKDYYSFTIKALECQDRVNSHVKDLETLRKRAKNVAEDVARTVSMKQQQASVIQAWQSVRQSDETIKQGRSIIVFTLATIIFLPLSFITSIFGMNSYEWSGSNDSNQPLFFAFSHWARTLIWSIYKKNTTKFLVFLGIYDLCFEYKKDSKKLMKDVLKYTDRTKMEAKEAWLKKREEKRQGASTVTSMNQTPGTPKGSFRNDGVGQWYNV
ncbi:hypothetical protein F5Y10DRAFT_288380 [Nemania abortiva]|nr:hypothetical protein F5Y10DRAFT_288380 [Nemania abortiva]